ncbi:hypothetical protein F5X99DRAFT_413332 [Biscogniauxia marginata]|nr:hypothetical protein F5X99DRAFT_413332 [Biscogniauxia marginata]
MSSQDRQQLALLQKALGEHETELLWSDFEAKLPDLFVTEPINCKAEVVDIIHTCGDDISSPPQEERIGSICDRNSAEGVSDVKGLANALNRNLPPRSSRVIILHRFNSWSRINASIDIFREICAYCRVIPQFLNIVMGFGRKLSPNDEDFMTCYASFSTSRGRNRNANHKPDRAARRATLACDLCYNIRYFERHGRELEDPWSCRQSAVYQKYYSDSKKSKWVVIQPPKNFTALLKKTKTCHLSHPMGLHIKYLGATIARWREYLNFIAERLQGFDYEVAISKPYSEFNISFSSKQQVHNLRLKLFHARSVLLNTANTLATIGIYESKLAKTCSLPTPIHESFQCEVRNMSSELENYTQTVRKLLSLSNGIRLMYDDILKFQAQEIMYLNGVRLTQIVQTDSAETKVIVSLADATARDSRIMRIATVIAMIYLPANLVMSFFSTVLVEYHDSDNSPALHIHRETWIAVLFTSILAACTFMSSWWWGKKEKKQYSGSIC